MRAVALVVIGVLVIAQPLTAVQVAVTLAGIYIAYKGIEAILTLIYVPHEKARDEEARPKKRSGALRRARRLAVPAIAVLLVAGVVAAFLGGGGASAPAAPISACNGHAALCDRRFDQVVLPATHNAMSAPLKGWFSAEQDRSIGGQLEDGIRGLLLDTHYADNLGNGRVRTYFPNKESLGLIKNQDGVSEQSFEAALRIPFTFPRASLLTAKVDRAASCGPNRGPSSAPLFLVNHWVSTDPAPRPSDATRVNAYAPLLARARVCESLRHRVPNLLAVNFYKEGDVFRVVDTLNGV